MVKRSISVISCLEELVLASTYKVENLQNAQYEHMQIIQQSQQKAAKQEQIIQDLRLRIKELEEDARLTNQLKAEMDDETCKKMIKEWWEPGASNKELVIKCDKVEMTGVLAWRDPIGLLSKIMAALQSPVEGQFQLKSQGAADSQ